MRTFPGGVDLTYKFGMRKHCFLVSCLGPRVVGPYGVLDSCCVGQLSLLGLALCVRCLALLSLWAGSHGLLAGLVRQAGHRVWPRLPSMEG